MYSPCISFVLLSSRPYEVHVPTCSRPDHHVLSSLKFPPTMSRPCRSRPRQSLVHAILLDNVLSLKLASTSKSRPYSSRPRTLVLLPHIATVQSHLVTLTMTGHFYFSLPSILARSTRSSHVSETVSCYKEWASGRSGNNTV